VGVLKKNGWVFWVGLFTTTLDKKDAHKSTNGKKSRPILKNKLAKEED